MGAAYTLGNATRQQDTKAAAAAVRCEHVSVFDCTV